MTKDQTKTARTRAVKAPATTPAVETVASPAAPALPGAVETLPVTELRLSDLNPRRGEPDPAGLAALTENIRAFGLVQNLAGLRTRDGAVTLTEPARDQSPKWVGGRDVRDFRLLQAPPLPARAHRPRRLALPALLLEPARGRGTAARARRRGLVREPAPMGHEVRPRDRPRDCGRRQPSSGCIWHLDEVRVSIGGQRFWLWRAVDEHGVVLEELLQPRRDKRAAKRLLRRLLKRAARPPKRIVTDKLASYAAAKREVVPGLDHRQHKGLNNRAENSHLPFRARERVMRGHRSPGGPAALRRHAFGGAQLLRPARPAAAPLKPLGTTASRPSASGAKPPASSAEPSGWGFLRPRSVNVIPTPADQLGRTRLGHQWNPAWPLTRSWSALRTTHWRATAASRSARVSTC